MKRGATPSVALAVRLDLQLDKELRRYCKKNGRSLRETVEGFLQQGLNRDEPLEAPELDAAGESGDRRKGDQS